MRRKSLEVTDENRIDEIINSCDCCHIGLVDGEKAYVVPLNFAYVHKNGVRIFYFHGASEGRKIDLIAKNRYAGFELDTGHRLHVKDTACNFSFGYQSVIGSGKISLITDQNEKEAALQLLMSHYTGKSDWVLPEKTVVHTAVIRLVVEELACKEHS